MSATDSHRFSLLNKWKSSCSKNRVCEFIDSVISGYAQIAFNDNTFSGILMIIATWIGSPVQCISAVWATLASTLCAYAFGVPKALVRRGLYGFNAALSGLAIPLVIFPGQELSLRMMAVSTIAAILCTFLTTIFQNFFGKWDVPALSSPYCAAVLILTFIGVLTNALDTTCISTDTLLFTTTLHDWTLIQFIHAVFNGASQVLWVEKPICGILYLLALFPVSRIDALLAITAAIVSTIVSVILGLPKDAVMLGLYGFNAVLLMQAWRLRFPLYTRNYLLSLTLAAFTPVVCVIFKIILAPLGLNSVLAFPYVTICILVFLTRKL
ncbi:MAG: urea transporter [Dorea sp.]